MQDKQTIRFHPLDLSQYGKTPKGDAIFRIVFADSRVEKVAYEGRMHELPLYAGKADGKWILERWKPGAEFVGMTPEAYQSLMKSPQFGGMEMEYPVDGEWDLFAIFPGHVIPQLAYEWAAMATYAGENISPAERALALRRAFEQGEREKEEKKDTLIQNVLERSNA